MVLVEKFEAFIRFEEAQAPLPCAQPLLVYRGDPCNSPDAALAFLAAAALAVIAWPDLDPDGLLQSSALPDLAGILAPSNPEQGLALHGRGDLYLNQLNQLDALALRGESRQLETALRQARRGIDQERMIGAGMVLRVWSV